MELPGGNQHEVTTVQVEPGILLVGTDPVAIDTIELDTITKKREPGRSPLTLGSQPGEHHAARVASTITIPIRTSFSGSLRTSNKRAS